MDVNVRLKAIQEYVLGFQDFLEEEFFYLQQLNSFEVQLESALEVIKGYYDNYYKNSLI